MKIEDVAITNTRSATNSADLIALKPVRQKQFVMTSIAQQIVNASPRKLYYHLKGTRAG